MFLTYFNTTRQVIVLFLQRFRYRHLRKRETEKLLRQVFGFSKNRSVYWARFIP